VRYARIVEYVPQQYEDRPVADLVLHPRNPNQGDVGAIATSIDAIGWYGAPIVQKSTGYILAGNHRVMAARHEGAETVPCLVIDVDDDVATRILVGDNRLAALAYMDDERALELLMELQATGGLPGTGYDEDDLDALVRSLQPFDLDELAAQVGDPVSGDLDPSVSVRVPPDVFAKWRAHVDTHMGDEPAAFAALFD